MNTFFVVFLSVFTSLNLYVAFRVAHLPWVHGKIGAGWVFGLILVLAWSFPVSRFLLRENLGTLSRVFEYAGALWMGVFFLILVCLLLAEVVTLGGWLFPSLAPQLRLFAVGAGLALSAFAIFQANRPLVVTRYDVTVPNLPKERDGTTLAVLTDMHLGNIIGESWLKRTIAQVDELKPDAVMLVGDMIDNDPRPVEPLLPILKTLRAPLGVFAVMGNHEYYAGDVASAGLMEQAGYTVLRNRNVLAAPGLVIAGVDDLTVASHDPSIDQVAMVRKTLEARPPGATVYLSHSPLRMTEASALGAGLMLCGHTHNGQIWPFNYLVKRRYPTVYGSYHYDPMTLLVSRGSGTWGPRMRLWSPGEIVLVRLRASRPSATPR